VRAACWLLLWLAAPAWGEDDANLEIIVYGDLMVERARVRVENNLKAQGYTNVLDKGDHAIYRHEAPHRGQVRLYEDGWMLFERQPVRFEGREMPWAKKNSALAWTGCIVWPYLCVRPGGQVVGKRKFAGVETRTVGQTTPDVRAYGDRIADREVDKKILSLPERLESLWTLGIPLSEGPALATPQARRAALFGFWDSRTNTEWGDEIRTSVAAFIRGVVQHSEHPYSEAEIARFNATRHSSRPLALAHKP
jgi:predicted RNA binding protein YcfA (HicA-like mRNA interferase family)